MKRWVFVATTVGVLALLGGCCCPRDGARTTDDPLRDVGVDLRGLVVPDATADARQVFLDMTIARVPQVHVETALGTYRPRDAGVPQTVPADRVPALVAAWRDNPDVRITSAPKILALPGQRATVFVGETVGFAKTAAVTNEEGGLEFSIEEDPDGPVHLGTRIAVVAHPSEDGRRLALEVVGSWTEHLESELPPDAVAGMTAAGFRTHVREHRLDVAFEMPGDGWVLMGDPAWIETDAGRVLQVVLLHALVLNAGAGE